MKVLVVGGAGFIGTGISEYAIKAGYQVTAITRKTHTWHDVTDKIDSVKLDWNNYNAAVDFMKDSYYDVVVDGLVYDKKMLERDLGIFKGKCKHYFFVSSAGVYNQPCVNQSEDMPINLNAIDWEVMRKKREAELFLEGVWDDLPFITTVIRPSITYGDTRIPGGLLSRKNQMTLIQRILDNKPIILAKDNGARHPLTRIDIFSKAVVGLFMRHDTHKQFFHIADDVSYTWDEVVLSIGNALNVKTNVIHIDVEKIKKLDKDMYEEVRYNKYDEWTLDNSKIKKYVPDIEYHSNLVDDFKAIIPKIKKYNQGNPLDEKFNIISDLLIGDYCKNGDDKKERVIAENYYNNLSVDYVKWLKKEERIVIKNEKNIRIRRRLKSEIKKMVPQCAVLFLKKIKK